MPPPDPVAVAELERRIAIEEARLRALDGEGIRLQVG